MDVYPFDIRISNALTSYVGYIGKMIWPAKLAVIYPYDKMVPAWQTWTACFLILGLTLLSMKCYKSRPWFPVGWLWFLGTLVPVIGLVQVGSQAMADRYTYVPLIGVFVLAVWTAAERIPRFAGRTETLAVGAILAGVGLALGSDSNATIDLNIGNRAAIDSSQKSNNITLEEKNFVDAIRQKIEPLVKSDDLIRQMKIIEAARKSAETGNAVQI